MRRISPDLQTVLKTGKQHIESLKDNRQVYQNGDTIDDVTKHDAFKNSIQSVGKLYDFVSDPVNESLMTYREEGSNERFNRIWQLPKNYEELVTRRKALEVWLEIHGGFYGRSPDHVASCVSGMYMGRDVFSEYDKDRACALIDYYRYARENDVFLTYVIINPQADRSKAAHEQADEFLTAGVVDEDSDGLVIRGAKMLATGGVAANEVLVTCIQPLRPGDERYAVSFAVPMNSEGLRILSRKSYEENTSSLFDNPLAGRFDENDALLYFDDVKVPWERVFINQDIAMCQKQFHGTPTHVYQNYQAQVRLMVKLKFLMGIARGIVETTGISNFPQVREILGELAADAQMVDALVHAMEIKGGQQGVYFIPDAATLYSAQVITQQLYPKLVNKIRELAGGGLIMLPSSVEDFDNPELTSIIEKTQQSPVTDSQGRVKFFRLAWDALGSEFGSRHVQYEMFYAGASFVTKAHCFRTYDWDGSSSLVDTILDSYTLEDELIRLKNLSNNRRSSLCL